MSRKMSYSPIKYSLFTCILGTVHIPMFLVFHNLTLIWMENKHDTDTTLRWYTVQIKSSLLVIAMITRNYNLKNFLNCSALPRIQKMYAKKLSISKYFLLHYSNGYWKARRTWIPLTMTGISWPYSPDKNHRHFLVMNRFQRLLVINSIRKRYRRLAK